MKSAKNFKISLEENSRKGKWILAPKSESESRAILKEKQVSFLKSYAEKENLCNPGVEGFMDKSAGQVDDL